MPFKSAKGKDSVVSKLLKISAASKLGLGLGGGGPTAPVSTTTGGNVDNLEPGNGYVYHTFTSSGTFVLSGDPISADILVVAGGGGGGAGSVFSPTTSGGGGGGVAWITTVNMDPGTFPVTIGPGGSGGPDSTNPKSGTNGGDTLFGPGTPLPITAKGGGFGAGEGPPTNGQPGGSGGGARSPNMPGGASIQHSENGPLVPLGLMNFGSPAVNTTGGGVAGAGPGTGGNPGGKALTNYDFEGDQIGVNPFGAVFGGGGGYRDGGSTGTPGGGYGGGGGGGPNGASGTQGIVIVRYLKEYSPPS